MIKITTHVLDISLGSPASGVAILVEEKTLQGWSSVSEGSTDHDGRYGSAAPPGGFRKGTYRITFSPEPYFSKADRETLYPEIAISFAVVADESYHIPLLLSPFGYSTYRGS